jgi:hypothetical protein
MKTILLQFWEESERGLVRPDGASLHIDLESYNSYIKGVYDDRDIENVPDEYDRVIGSLLESKVSDDIYNVILKEKNMRIPQYQLNNLIKLKNIIP